MALRVMVATGSMPEPGVLTPPAAVDASIMERLQRREVSALGELYDRYGRLCFSLAYHLLGDRGLAEDVVQESFLSVWRQATSYDQRRGTARTWLLSIVHHRAIDQLRQRRGARVISLATLESQPAADETDQRVLIQLEQERVRRALRALPPEQRRVVELAFFAGYSQPEIAVATSVPLSTVKGRLRLALVRLRLALRR